MIEAGTRLIRIQCKSGAIEHHVKLKVICPCEYYYIRMEDNIFDNSFITSLEFVMMSVLKIYSCFGNKMSTVLVFCKLSQKKQISKPFKMSCHCHVRVIAIKNI